MDVNNIIYSRFQMLTRYLGSNIRWNVSHWNPIITIKRATYASHISQKNSFTTYERSQGCI